MDRHCDFCFLNLSLECKRNTMLSQYLELWSLFSMSSQILKIKMNFDFGEERSFSCGKWFKNWWKLIYLMVNDVHWFDTKPTGVEWIGRQHRNDSLITFLALVIRQVGVVDFFRLRFFFRLLVVHDGFNTNDQTFELIEKILI